MVDLGGGKGRDKDGEEQACENREKGVYKGQVIFKQANGDMLV